MGLDAGFTIIKGAQISWSTICEIVLFHVDGARMSNGNLEVPYHSKEEAWFDSPEFPIRVGDLEISQHGDCSSPNSPEENRYFIHLLNPLYVQIVRNTNMGFFGVVEQITAAEEQLFERELCWLCLDLDEYKLAIHWAVEVSY